MSGIGSKEIWTPVSYSISIERDALCRSRAHINVELIGVPGIDTRNVDQEKIARGIAGVLDLNSRLLEGGK